MEPMWFSDPYVGTDRAHAFCHPGTTSLCGQSKLSPEFVIDADLPHCVICSRVVLQRKLAHQAEQTDVHWRDVAVQAVLGDGWTYEELSSTPAWRESVDRTAVALQAAYDQGVKSGRG